MHRRAWYRSHPQTPLDEAALTAQLQAVFDTGIRSVAVVFIHAYLHAAHEQRARELAVATGFTHVTISSDAMPMAKAVPRGCACLGCMWRGDGPQLHRLRRRIPDAVHHALH